MEGANVVSRFMSASGFASMMSDAVRLPIPGMDSTAFCGSELMCTGKGSAMSDRSLCDTTTASVKDPLGRSTGIFAVIAYDCISRARE